MAEVTGTATSYDLQNYVGELFLSGDTPRAFLTRIGAAADLAGNMGLRAPRVVGSNIFSTNVDYDLDAAAQPAILDGADATFDEHDTSVAFNTVQIFQEGIALSYSAQSNADQLNELGTSGVAVAPGGGQGAVVNPAQLDFQVARKLEQIKRDMNFSFLRGTYNIGAAATARQTRGLRNALSTNVFANAAVNRALTVAIFEAALKDMIANGAFSPGDRVTAYAGADQFENLVDLYASSAEAPRDRNEAGLMIRTVWTKWGPVDVVYESDMAAGEIVIAQERVIRPVAREIRSGQMRKGLLFLEPLSKAGAADKWQLYGEWGIDYGPEWMHGVIDDLSA